MKSEGEEGGGGREGGRGGGRAGLEVQNIKDRSLLLHFIFPFFLASSTLPLLRLRRRHRRVFSSRLVLFFFTRVGKKARLGTEKACYPRASWRC